MNLLVSDYDNTFHIEDKDMKRNVERANFYMKDNMFVIATGRSYDSYLMAKEQFNIQTNYTVINHGATILKGNQIIYNHPIEEDVKNEITKLLHLEHALQMYFYSTVYEVDITNKEITKIRVEYDDESIIPEIFAIIGNKFSTKLKAYLFSNHRSIEIVSKDVDKYYAIDYISKLENIDNIYVIGDSLNDYLMIKNYNGSCTHVAIEEVKKIAKKQYQNVSDFIDEIVVNE